MVVHGGRAAVYPHLKKRLSSIAGTLELYVLTHIDADHIQGALAHHLEGTAGWGIQPKTGIPRTAASCCAVPASIWVC